MIQIDSKCVLLYLLSCKYSEMDFELLTEIENKIFKYNPFIFVDFNQDTICSIIEHNPKIFEWSNNIIKTAKDIDREYVNSFCDNLNASLPNEIKAIL